MTTPIRFGVLSGSSQLPAWQVRCLEQLLSLPEVECALRVRLAPQAVGWERGRGVGAWLFRRYRDLWARPRAQRALGLPAGIAAAPLLPGDVSVAVTREQIASQRLDFLLQLGGPEPAAATCGLARLGVFAFQVGSFPQRWPELFAELSNGEDTVCTALVRWVSRGRAIPLKQARFAVVRHSYRRGIDELRFATAHWPREVCVDIRNGNTDLLSADPLEVASHDATSIARSPSAASVVRFAARQLVELCLRVARDLLQHEQWTIGVAQRPIHTFLAQPDAADVCWLPVPDRDHYLADPFAAGLDGKRVVLAEWYDHRSSFGKIAGLTLDLSAAPEPVAAIEADVHLSYPFVFEHAGAIWCIPESCAAREIALYRADPQSGRWQRVATLLDGVAAADATLFRHDGLFWLAFNDVERGRHRDLCLYYASELLGPWSPHATNPVLMDVSCARPAGTPFVHAGELYRPAQDCGAGYGAAVVIRRITRLSPTCFREQTAAVVRPDPASAFPDGLHTLSAAGNVTLLDAKRSFFHPRAALHMLRSALLKRVRSGRS